MWLNDSELTDSFEWFSQKDSTCSISESSELTTDSLTELWFVFHLCLIVNEPRMVTEMYILDLLKMTLFYLVSG